MSSKHALAAATVLVREEVNELLSAAEAGDDVAVHDAVVDLTNATVMLAIALGVGERAWEAAEQSMLKRGRSRFLNRDLTHVLFKGVDSATLDERAAAARTLTTLALKPKRLVDYNSLLRRMTTWKH